SGEEVNGVLERAAPAPLLAVRAPIDGSVLQTDVTRGRHVAAGDALFRVADLSTLWVAIDLYESDLAYVSPGDSVTLQVKAFPGRAFPGRIARVGQVMDSVTRTVRTRGVVASRGRLKPGMLASVTIHPAGPSARILAIPAAAVQRIDDRPVAFVRAGPGRFRVRRLTTGIEQEGYVEVVEGLQPGDTVVTRGSFLLKSELLKATFAEDEGDGEDR
ncbi:MAG TPA: efflux RND transporter periplasmic adaptor subunit, partial [Longimicrobiales bacterium]|nr:efflux RND transporter periplasmic adaptor subunit [Longimicrobiales bacterium]